MTTRAIFLYKFFLKPTKIESVTPSSSFLTRKMLGNLPWDKIETIAELGAGTGVFTNFIAENKNKSCQVVVIEEDFEMRKMLRVNHPEFFYGTKAEKLDWLLQRNNLPQVDCIISGLPFAAFTEPQREEIMAAIHRSLKPGGVFVAFQYSLQMKKTLKKTFSELRISFVPLNMPPAFVYHC
jgi:phospholipid N-methyltransferase